jgi:hypothetical protein
VWNYLSTLVNRGHNLKSQNNSVYVARSGIESCILAGDGYIGSLVMTLDFIHFSFGTLVLGRLALPDIYTRFSCPKQPFDVCCTLLLFATKPVPERQTLKTIPILF